MGYGGSKLSGQQRLSTMSTNKYNQNINSINSMNINGINATNSLNQQQNYHYQQQNKGVLNMFKNDLSTVGNKMFSIKI